MLKIKSFLGLVMYYRPFIPNCAEICQPLTEQTDKKKVRFRWNDEGEAFKLLLPDLVDALKYVPINGN
jgi:hypothetical protein